jgi:hypothetical protein
LPLDGTVQVQLVVPHPAPFPPVDRVLAGPWRDAVYATTSKRFGTASIPTPAAAPKRWPRSSGWSPTTSPETIPSKRCGCPEKWSPRSPRSDTRSRHTAVELLAKAKIFQTHNVDNRSPEATAAGRDSPGTPAPWQSKPRTRSDSAGSLPSLPTLAGVYCESPETKSQGYVFEALNLNYDVLPTAIG